MMLTAAPAPSTSPKPTQAALRDAPLPMELELTAACLRTSLDFCSEDGAGFASDDQPALVPFLGYQLPCCYLLKDCLTSTGCGEQLWAATKVADGSAVILKVLIPSMNTDEATAQRRVQRALTEAVVLKHMSPHPFIVDFVEQFAAGDVVVTVTKHVEGRNLSEQLQSMKSTGRHFTEAEAFVIITQLLLALKHCHDRDVVHRDVRMSNIFLHTSGLLKLGDFDRAKCRTNNAVDYAASVLASMSSAVTSASPTFQELARGSAHTSLVTFPAFVSVSQSHAFLPAAVGNVNSSERSPDGYGCNAWCRSGADLLKVIKGFGDTGRKVTPYTAPELLLPEGTCTPKSDVWAAGVVLFQLLTGAPPFEGQSQAEMRMSIARGLRGPQWDALSHRAKHVLQGMLNPCSACRWDATAALQSKYIQNSLRALKSAVRPHHGQVTPELGDAITHCIDACIESSTMPGDLS